MRKSQLLLNLRNLRLQYETFYREDFSMDMPEQDTCILYDVCAALGLAEAEISYVLGENYETYFDTPIPYTLTPAGAFVVAFGQTPPTGALAPAAPLEDRNNGKT